MNGVTEAGVYRRTPDGGSPGPSEPDATDLARAQEIVSAAHPPTPLILSPTLSRRVGKEVHLKLEGTSAVRSFTEIEELRCLCSCFRLPNACAKKSLTGVSPGAITTGFFWKAGLWNWRPMINWPIRPAN